MDVPHLKTQLDCSRPLDHCSETSLSLTAAEIPLKYYKANLEIQVHGILSLTAWE